MTVFIDTSVIMYAAGAPHRHRASCQAVLRQVASGELEATTSVEVVHEILHRFSRGQRETGALMAQHVLDVFGPLLPVDHATIADAVT
ncbi:MAG: VapC toxin family PIN domain ribonuclease, partial [Actinomycetota bacterium]|nr:VapC toxin family PIN domain ribonuclease [Actinomycetota bacterium]